MEVKVLWILSNYFISWVIFLVGNRNDCRSIVLIKILIIKLVVYLVYN